MPYTVTGRFADGSAYQVQLTEDSNRPAVGSARVTALLSLHIGELIRLSPIGPMRRICANDAISLAAALRKHTNVVELQTMAGRPQ